MYIKKNARVTFRSNRRSNFKRNNNFSNNKSRNKGNVTQLYNKFLKLAKESSSGDRIQSEYYYQFADHYYRIMIELGISLEENDLNENVVSADTSEINNNEKDVSLEKSKDLDENNSNDPNESNNDDLQSIESIPFISEPVKKQTTKTKNASA